MKRTLKPLLLLLTVSAVAACSTMDGVKRGAETRASASLPAVKQQWRAIETEVVGEPVGWIASFNDPVLSALVKEAQDNNRDLAAAASAVEASRAAAGLANAALSPQVSVGAGTQNQGLVDGPDTSSTNLGLQAGWEVDLWGRLRAGREGAVQSLEAAEADYTFSQYSIAAAVANGYFAAIEAARQKALSQSLVEALEETDRITRVRYDNGIGNAQDVALSQSNLSDARDSLIEIQGAERNALRALEVLLGRYPGADLRVRTTLPDLPPPLPVGVPADILERRPDLIAAERRIAEAIAGQSEAKAARLPTLSLTSSVGGSSSDLSNLLDPSNLAWTAASNLLAPIFDGGARQAQVALANAELDAAAAQYAAAALAAFSEVEQALDQETVLRKRRAELDQSAEQAAEALRLALLRYDEGETDLIDVLNIQSRVVGAQRNLINVQRRQLSERINLTLALGGSWE
ncbi:MAG: efflux transporter outer membrane subunit [Pseudomonadota bacterium]